MRKFTNFLREFPIRKLLSATDMKQLTAAIDAIFAHLKLQVRRCFRDALLTLLCSDSTDEAAH